MSAGAHAPFNQHDLSVGDGLQDGGVLPAYTIGMEAWQVGALAALIVVAVAVAAFLARLHRSVMTGAEGTAELRAMGLDVVRLPGRLRRVAADPRTPRKARWALVVLAIYVASPIDPIPDFIPGVGHLDELVIVPLALARIRRMIPPEVWAEHFPPRAARPSS